jgi:pimeloyl-ACP methyl ester carboxylesterase
MTRLFYHLFCLALLLGLALEACTPPPTARPKLELQPCKLEIKGAGASMDASCGKWAVLEDRSSPAGRKIDLNIAVIPAINRSPNPDPVFLIAGGPGEAATESFPLLMDALTRLHQSRDLVMVDQRGTGGSNPLTCPEDQTQPADLDISFEQSLAFLKTCRQKLAGDPRFYTTEAAVADLDEVRQALGYNQVNLLGVSYGTRVALVYLRQYEAHVRTVTLDSVDPTQWELGPYNAANAQRALDLFFQRCTAEADCQKAFPDLRQEFNALVDRLDKNPVKVSLRHPVSGEEVTLTLDRKELGFALQILSYEPETAALIPLLIHSASVDNHYDLLLAQAMTSQGSLSDALSTGVYYSALCAEDVPFYPAQPLAGASFLPDATAQMKSFCQAWNVPAAAASFKDPVTSNRPVLLFTGEADPVTPPENARDAARTLSNSLTVEAPGMGHAVFVRGCLPKVLADFVTAGSKQGLDTSCVNQIKPQSFYLNFSGTRP